MTKARRSSGSSPWPGSSTTITAGLKRSRAAWTSRWRSPRDSVPNGQKEDHDRNGASRQLQSPRRAGHTTISPLRSLCKSHLVTSMHRGNSEAFCEVRWSFQCLGADIGKEAASRPLHLCSDPPNGCRRNCLEPPSRENERCMKHAQTEADHIIPGISFGARQSFITRT